MPALYLNKDTWNPSASALNLNSSGRWPHWLIHRKLVMCIFSDTSYWGTMCIPINRVTYHFPSISSHLIHSRPYKPFAKSSVKFPIKFIAIFMLPTVDASFFCITFTLVSIFSYCLTSLVVVFITTCLQNVGNKRLKLIAVPFS